MNLGETIRSGVRWVIAGKVGQDLLQFAVSIVLARLLMPSDFGLLVTVQIFTGVAGFVSGGGMGQALVQSKTLGPRDSHVVFTAQLCVCILIYALFYLSSPAFAAWFHEPQYENLLRVSASTFLIRPFSNTPNSLLHREMRYKATAFTNIAILITTATTSVTLALLGKGVWSLIFGGIAGGVTSAIAASMLSGWRPRIAFDVPTLRRYANYGIKVSLNDIVLYLHKQSGNFVVSRFLGTETVGLFNKAVSLNDKPSDVLSGAAYQVVFRALAKMQGDLNQSKYVYLRTLTLVSVYTLPIYVGLWWLAEPFIATVYGIHWSGAAPILQIIVLSKMFDILNNQSGAVAAARQLLGRELVIQLIAWATIIIGIAIGYRKGTTGIAWATVFNSILFSLMMARLACRELQVRPREVLRAFQPALLLNAILVAVLGPTDLLIRATFGYKPIIYLVLMSAAGTVCYGMCFLFLPIPQLAKETMRWKQRLQRKS